MRRTRRRSRGRRDFGSPRLCRRPRRRGGVWWSRPDPRRGAGWSGFAGRRRGTRVGRRPRTGVIARLRARPPRRSRGRCGPRLGRRRTRTRPSPTRPSRWFHRRRRRGGTRPRPRARRGSNRSRSPRGHPRSPRARRGRAGTHPQPRSASWSRRMSSRSPYGATWPWHSWPRRASRGASPRPRPSQPSPPSDPSRRCARDEPSRSAGPSRDTPAPRAPKCNREPIPRRTREHPAKLHTRVRESRQAPRGVTRERDDDRLFPRGARRRPHRQISRVHRAHRSRRTDRDARASVSTSETKKNSGPRGVARIGKRKSGGASGKGFLSGTPVCLFSRMFDPVQISIKISECYLSDKFPTHLGDIIGSRTELPAEIVKRREQAPPEISGSSVLNQSDFLSFSDVRMIS